MNIDPDAAMAYLGFVEARHQAWAARQKGLPAPWTDEPIVQRHKFTNVFRAIDYGSQFLIERLLHPGLSDEDTLTRCLLYRSSGKWQAWEWFELYHGRMPLLEDLENDVFLDTLTAYRGKSSGQGVYRTFERGIFTSAYIVFPGRAESKGTDKLETIVNRVRTSVEAVLPRWVAAAQDPEAQFEALTSVAGIAEFIGMQVLTDWGYSDQCGEDRENAFVAPGPGCVRGARELGSGKPLDLIRWAQEQVWEAPWCPRLELSSGGVRLPSLMDIQNTFCEFSKYVRFADRPLPAKHYTPLHPGAQPDPTLPAHWSA